MKKPTPLEGASARTVWGVEHPEYSSDQRIRQVASALNPRGAEHAEIPHQVRCRLAATANAAPGVSIPEFCEAHGISEGFFHKLKKQGEGPREMKVGSAHADHVL